MLLEWGGLLALGKKSKLLVSPLVILMVSLLSGCSLMEKAGIINRQCQAAETSRYNYNKEAKELQAEARKYDTFSGTIEQVVKGRDLADKSFVAYELSMRVILTYPNCFTPEQVVEAQQYLDKVK